MAEPSPIRIIGEGDIWQRLIDINSAEKGFIGSNVIVAQQLSISDAFIYTAMLPRVLDLQAAVIIPLPQPSVLPFNIKSNTIRLIDINTFQKIKPGSVYKLKSNTNEEAIELLSQTRKLLFPRNEKSTPLIFVIDSIHKWSEALDTEIRYLIREALTENISVWIHCPISLIPTDLLAIVGNIFVLWPSQYEIEIINKYLPLENMEFRGQEIKKGYFFFNRRIEEGKYWQFQEFPRENK